MTNRTKVRLRIKIQFVILYRQLFFDFEKAVILNRGISLDCTPWTSKESQKILKLAREKIGYSPNYVDVDLWQSLYYLHNKVLKEEYGQEAKITEKV